MNYGFPSRRQILSTSASGFGWLAACDLMHKMAVADAAQATNPLAPKEPHFPAKAKRVIFLFMRGGPSQVDTFDYKPKLNEDDGKEIAAVGSGAKVKLLGSPWKFAQHGESGLWVSELFPEVAKRVDDLCIIRSMQTDLPAHPQAVIQAHCGMTNQVRPSMGSWVTYGLGTENESLPGYLVLSPSGMTRSYNNAFLPAIHQATLIGTEGKAYDPSSISNLANTHLPNDLQRDQLDYAQMLNRAHLARSQVNPQIEGAIQSFELAFRMQTALPEVLDLSKETKTTKEMYGIGSKATDDFGSRCLAARRLIEAGVRFVELNSSGDPNASLQWDQHRNLKVDHELNAKSVDLPISGLLADLKARGLLDETLVIWGGEFGRTPHAQNKNGRDHNNRGYTIWMAGGGVKPGFAYGMTDEYGAEAIENRVHIHDWHATVLHLLGMDHERLTYPYAGRAMRLTDTKGRVVSDIIA